MENLRKLHLGIGRSTYPKLSWIWARTLQKEKGYLHLPLEGGRTSVGRKNPEDARFFWVEEKLF